MAKTALERKRAQLEREAEQIKEADELTRPFLSKPFFEYLDTCGNWINVDMALDMAGVSTPRFDDDSGAKSYTGSIEDLDPDIYPRHSDSIGKAELLFDGLLDAATQLADLINEYKRAEIDKAIAALEEADLSTPEAKKAALEQMALLTKIREQLHRNFRRTFPTIRVKIV